MRGRKRCGLLASLASASAVSVSLRRAPNNTAFDPAQFSTSFDDGESLEPPDWVKKMTEHFDISPSSRQAAEKAWADAAKLDGGGGDEMQMADGFAGGMWSGMNNGNLPPQVSAMMVSGGMQPPTNMQELMPSGGAPMLPGGARPVPAAFNPSKASAGGSGPAITGRPGGGGGAGGLPRPPLSVGDRDPDFTGELAPAMGRGELAARALEQARAALRDAERAAQEAERARKAAILAGRQLGADLTKELPDAKVGPTLEMSEADAGPPPPDASKGPADGAAGGGGKGVAGGAPHRSAGGNGPSVGDGKRFGRSGGRGGGGGIDGEGGDDVPYEQYALEEETGRGGDGTFAPSSRRAESVDDGEGGPEE